MAETRITPSLLLLGLIVSATAANSVIFFAGAETRIMYSELIIIASASIAALLGVLLAIGRFFTIVLTPRHTYASP